MIKITVADGKFVVNGCFDLGYMGVYRNEQIKVDADVSAVRLWDIAESYRDASEEELARGLAYYFNSFEEKVQQNIKQVNDNFLMRIYSDMHDVENVFWNTDELTVASKMPQDVRIIYTANTDEYLKIQDEYFDRPNDGTEEKTDVQAWIKKKLPMFSLDRLLSGIVTEYLYLGDGTVTFQCSDDVGCEILCAACDTLDEDLRFTDWHNF